MNPQELPIAYLGPEWRCCDVAEDPIYLDPARGYARWLEVTGRGEVGQPHYGLGRTFPAWSPVAAAARAIVARAGGSFRGRHLPFEPVALSLDVAGVGQVPTTRSSLECLARNRRGCFLSREVAAGAAFDALLCGLVPRDGGYVDSIVADADLAAAEVAGEAEEGRHLWLCRWSFPPESYGPVELRLRDATRDLTGSHLLPSEFGRPLPDFVTLPF